MISIGVALLLISPTVLCLRCSSSEYNYEFTECDSSGQRWRVAVPRSANIDCDLPEAQRGINCSFSCNPGNYLDVDTQKCRQCNAGRYSLGGGIRFEEFVTLPHGFSIENFDSSSDILSDSTGSTAADNQPCPPESGWQLRDGELLYVPSPCVSRLSFSASLVRAGLVDFTYRMPRNNRALSMHVDVRNEQCQSYREAVQSMMAKYSSKGSGRGGKEESNGDWKRRRLDMKTGPNVISWTVSNSAGFQSSTEPIRISHIDVLGLAFTRECSLCPAGTYSLEGAAECLSCEPGHFAPKGSEKCGKCPLSQYSGPKANRCEDRPPCRPSDFYPVSDACINGTTTTSYKKVQPAVCREDLPGASTLPPPEPPRPCPKCSPGMAKNGQGICEFCPKNHFSEGNACARCPVDTVPDYGYQFSQWDVLPPIITTRCEYISEDVVAQCDIGESWLASGPALISAPSLQKGIAMEMIISIEEGFNNPLAPKDVSSIHAPISQMTVVFETSCADSSCILYFIEDTSPEHPRSSFFKFLAVFNGTQPRRVWSHSIVKHSPAKFMVAFLRSGSTSGEDAISDQARILSLNVTHVGSKLGKQGGGASRCLPCPKGGKGGCVPCPGGHYMHTESHTCTRCPVNTIVNVTSTREGLESCQPCGKNLISKDGVTCTTDGHFKIVTSNQTLSYNLSPWLNKSWVAHGVKVFAREGASYFHSFNLSLFAPPVRCQEQFQNLDPSLTDMNRDVVEGAACRLTALPDSRNNKSSIAFVSPLLLASRLEAISGDRSYNGWRLTNQMLEYEGVDNSSLPMDVHLWFDSVGVPSEACPRGNALAVTARCSPTHTQANVRLPLPCPDGTCDGCLFHIIIEAAQACPVCNPGDYQQIKGECKEGKQTIHFIPDKHCVLSGAAAASHEEACSVLSSGERMLLIGGSIALLVLTITLFVICRRNKRLEYKYTRLVETRTGELPVAETCGLEEDEDEDEDRVTFSKGKRKLFGRGEREDRAAFVPLENED